MQPRTFVFGVSGLDGEKADKVFNQVLDASEGNSIEQVIMAMLAGLKEAGVGISLFARNKQSPT